MAWSTDQIFGCYLYLIRKNQAGGVSDLDFFYNWNLESRAYWVDLRGRFNRNNNSKEGISSGLIENQVVTTSLSPFTKFETIPVISGVVTKPGNFGYLLALRETITQERVWYYNKDQKYFINKSVIDPPSVAEANFYFTEYGNTYTILPPDTASVDLDYISMPVDIVWGFTIVGGRQVYDPSSSIQPEWGQASIDEITKRSLKASGVTYHDQEYGQYANSIISTGD